MVILSLPLDRAATRKVTVISATAGSGKTSLLRAWAEPSPAGARDSGHASRCAAGLHRLRLAGELAEIRAADLRFSERETRELLDTSGIALSLAGHPDPERFVAEFSRSERTVAEYLLAEMLERQLPAVQDLLLRTCLLERVSGELTAPRPHNGHGSCGCWHHDDKPLRAYWLGHARFSDWLLRELARQPRGVHLPVSS